MARTKKVKNELEIVESSKVNEIFPPMDEEKLKDELKDYVNVLVKKSFEEEYEKANKRLIREKSRKIFFKNVIILFLLAIIGFLLYVLISNGYFKKYISINHNDEIIQKEDVVPRENTEKEIVPSQDELKAQYGYLLDKYTISDKSIYLNDYYNGNLTDDLKKYLVLNTIDFNTLKREDDFNIIDEITFKDAYSKIFDDEIVNSTFDFNGNKIRYINSMQAYLTTNPLEKDNSNIKREISNIEVKDDNIYIMTVEIVKTSEKVNVDDENNIDNVKSFKMVYTFKSEKLINLSRIDW